MILEQEWPALRSIETSNVPKLKQLLAILNMAVRVSLLIRYYSGETRVQTLFSFLLNMKINS